MLVRRTYAPLTIERASVVAARNELSGFLVKFLDEEAPKNVSRQVRRYQERHMSPAEVWKALDFNAWKAIIPVAKRAISASAEELGISALWHVGVSDDEPPGAIVRRYASTYAKSRAAEMVGMRHAADGLLEVNPSAQYAITDTTRQMVRDLVQTAVEQEMPAWKLAMELRKIGAFAPSRAELIARTELVTAWNKGEMAAYRTSGVVTGTRWVTMKDDRVEAHCRENARAGVIPLGAAYPSGHKLPPVHPRCRCHLAAVTELNPAG